MVQKEFKSIDEQLEILSARGLKIEDYDEAKDFLLKNNYYRVSGYLPALRANNIYATSLSFKDVIDIYHFDHEFRHIILSFIDIIEVKMKSIYVYEFTNVKGPFGYLDVHNFIDSLKHEEILRKTERQKNKRLPYERQLKRYADELSEPIPFWAYVDFLTISDISFLYSISEPQLMNHVAMDFGFKTNKAAKILAHHMRSMTIVRNLCAHGCRLYNRLFEQKPSLSKDELSLLKKDSKERVDNAHFYGFFIVMKRLLSNNEFLSMKNLIISLTEKYPHVDIGHYGFRTDWEGRL